MRIKSISIENYRQYKKLEFSFKNIKELKNDLNIIIAQNGVGKSNFLNAITWCLYEEESHLQDKNKALPLVNLQTIDETEEKGIISVKVLIKVEVNGEEKTIIREAKYAKNSSIKAKVLRTESHLIVKQKIFNPVLGYSVIDDVYDEYAEGIVNRMFPKGISQYFFFDNEQMNNYFKANSGGAIERAINEISKVSLVQNVDGRLKSAESDFKVDLGQNSELIDSLQKETTDKENKLNSEKAELNAIKEDIAKAINEIDELNEQLKGVENLKSLEESRKTLNDSLEDIKKDIDEIEEELNQFIVRQSTLIRMYPSFVETLNLIDQKDKDRQLPPDISLEVLKRSKDSKVCELCGNHIDEEHLKNVIEKLNRFNVATPVFELLLGIKRKVLELKSEAENYPNAKKAIMNKREAKYAKLEETQSKLNDIIKEMKSIPNQEEVTRKIDKREALTKTLNNLHEAKGLVDGNIKKYEQELNEANLKFENAINAQEKAKDKANKYNSVRRLRAIISEVEKETIEEMRHEISVRTFENFSNLIWKKNTYDRVEIDKDYNVDLIHVKGNSAIGSTSAAERALLALSFTNAIHEISGFESPIVIDSPVGRVSDENRRKFAESLAEISKRKQIIMLFTPDEYSKDISEVFDSIAVKSFASMNQSEDVTTIKEA